MPNSDIKLGVSSKYHQRNICFVQHTVTWRQFQDQTCLPQPMASIGAFGGSEPQLFRTHKYLFQTCIETKIFPPWNVFPPQTLKPICARFKNFKTQNRNHKLLYNKSRSLIQSKANCQNTNVRVSLASIADICNALNYWSKDNRWIVIRGIKLSSNRTPSSFLSTRSLY